jgi:inosine-uridine nucleoside N-ribohydrolase
MARGIVALTACASFLFAAGAAARPAHADAGAARAIIIDTDIGVDIDDAFALGDAVADRGVRVVAITTASGNVRMRARLVDRFLAAVRRRDIPVGIGTTTPGPFDEYGHAVVETQARWAAASPVAPRAWAPATPLILDAIRRAPGQITLVCIGPLTNVAALIDRDPVTFRKLKRIAMMGGSVRVGYADGAGHAAKPPPVAEYNIAEDIPAAQKVFRAGVPIDLYPLDSTQVRLERPQRDLLFAQSTPLTDALTLLYHLWAEFSPWGGGTPTLYDVVPVMAVTRPDLCPTQPMRIVVDARGFTREVAGAPNAMVCLHVQTGALRELLLRRLSVPLSSLGSVHERKTE